MNGKCGMCLLSLGVVMIIEQLSDNHAVKRKPACFNRSRSALSSPYIVPAGFKEDGSKRFMTIRTAWNNAASGACQYASTDEGKADSDCVGCLWRVGE